MAQVLLRASVGARAAGADRPVRGMCARPKLPGQQARMLGLCLLHREGTTGAVGAFALNQSSNAIPRVIPVRVQAGRASIRAKVTPQIAKV